MGIKELTKVVLTLVCMYLGIGALLALVHGYTEPVLEKHKKAALAESMQKDKLTAVFKKLLPSGEEFTKAGEWTTHDQKAPYYIARNKNGAVGYVIDSYGKGYSSLIHVIIGVNVNLTVNNIDVLFQQETPGLGDQILGDEFRSQFAGKDLQHLTVATSDPNGNIQALTGATISSRAVTEDAVMSAVMFLRGLKN